MKKNNRKYKKKPPVWKHPYKVEREYLKALNNMVELIKVELVKAVDYYSYLEGVAGYKADSWNNDLDGFMFRMGENISKIISGKLPDITKASENTNKFNSTQWRNQVKKTMGIDLFLTEKWILPAMKNFVSENVTKIKNISDTTMAEVRSIISNGIQSQDRVETIAKRILQGTKLKALGNPSTQSVYRKIKKRAEFIAINEVSNFNGMLMEKRQSDIGVKTYFWRNAKDLRVRGNPNGLYPKAKYSHWSREGKEFAWSSSSGRYPKGVNPPPPDGHPARPYRCRCYAEPNFNTIVR